MSEVQKILHGLQTKAYDNPDSEKITRKHEPHVGEAYDRMYAQ